MPTFYAMLVKTVFMFKPLEARNVSWGHRQHTDTTTDIATYRLNWPTGKFSEKEHEFGHCLRLVLDTAEMRLILYYKQGFSSSSFIRTV